MFENISTDYSGSDATIEILVMLFVAFTIGALIGWMLKPSKKYVKKIITPTKIGYVEAKKGATASSSISVKKNKSDDLQIIEGIGPKIEKHLNNNGVKTYNDLISEDVTGLEAILLEGGSKLRMHSPTTWPDQAKLARDAKWSELEEYQGILNGGRKK